MQCASCTMSSQQGPLLCCLQPNTQPCGDIFASTIPHLCGGHWILAEISGECLANLSAFHPHLCFSIRMRGIHTYIWTHNQKDTHKWWETVCRQYFIDTLKSAEEHELLLKMTFFVWWKLSKVYQGPFGTEPGLWLFVQLMWVGPKAWDEWRANRSHPNEPRASQRGCCCMPAVCPLYARAMPDDHHLLINSGNEMPVNGYDHCAVYYKTTVLNRSSYLSE